KLGLSLAPSPPSEVSTISTVSSPSSFSSRVVYLRPLRCAPNIARQQPSPAAFPRALKGRAATGRPGSYCAASRLARRAATAGRGGRWPRSFRCAQRYRDVTVSCFGEACLVHLLREASDAAAAGV